MMKYDIKRIIPGLALSVLSVLAYGCSQERTIEMMRGIIKAPGATIERDVKGHEMISSIQAVLRYAIPDAAKAKEGIDEYFVYDIPSKPVPFPFYQEIDIKKDDSGNLVVTSDRKYFDVIKGDKVFYGLELKYFDVNGQLINHQFSSFDPIDLDASTLEEHQTFFTIQNYSLDRLPLMYPMTLDSLYLDDFLLKKENGRPVRAGLTSSSIIYLPNGYVDEGLRYDRQRALLASDAVMTPETAKEYHDKSDGKTYRLYVTIGHDELMKRTKELFTYEYRDTDPVNEPLGKAIVNDDLPDFDDNGISKGTFRSRLGQPVKRLRIDRSLNDGQPLDALGLKGMMQFKRKDVCFQMRVSLCHILTESPFFVRPGTGKPRTGKYDRRDRGMPVVHPSDEPGASWNNYDLDFPLAFRVIADADDPRNVFKEELGKYYNDAPEDIDKVLSDDPETVSDYFRKLYFGQPPFKM